VPTAPPVPLSRLSGLLRPHRGRILAAAGMAVLVAALAGASVGFLKPAVETIAGAPALHDSMEALRTRAPFLSGLADRVESAAAADPLDALLLLLGLVVVLSVLRGLLRWGHETLVAVTAQAAATDLLGRMHRSLLRQDVGHVQRTGAASYVTRFTADADAVAKGLETLAGTLVFEPLSFAAYAAVAFLVSWKLALLAVITLPLLAMVVRLVSRAVRRSTKRVLEKRQGLATRVEEGLRGIRVVQAYGAEEAEAAGFGALNGRVFAEFRRLARLEAATGPALELLALLGLSAALLAGGALALRGEVTAGDLVVVFAALGGMYDPVRKIGGAMNRVQAGLAGAERILEVVDRPPGVADADGARPLPAGRGEIELRGVTVRHPGGATALDGVSVRIPAGTRLAVVGASGAGKSTLLNLVPRFLDPDEGSVLVDGADVRRCTLASLRGALALVPQEVFLREGSVRENVLYGRPGASASEVEEACRAARVTEFAARLPGGLDAPVGPAGALLSGGERQRVAVARAMLRDPRVLLLDEPAQSLDAAAEAVVMDALERLSAGRTTILVTHRSSAAARCDRILVLDAGRAVACGPHAELLDSSPAYRALCSAADLDARPEPAR
jgi:subfamily B ATP-binding cassette protein MsbA